MEDALISLGVACIGAVIGALAGLGLGFSFTTLSPLIIGALVAGAFPAFIAACIIGVYCYFYDNVNTKKQKNFVEKRAILAATPLIGTIVLTDIAIGVGIAAVADAILPGIFATRWAAAAGAVIGAVLLPGTILAIDCALWVFGKKIVDYACNPQLSLKDVYLSKEEKKREDISQSNTYMLI